MVQKTQVIQEEKTLGFTLTTRLSAIDHERLLAASESLGMKRTTLIRTIVREYLSTNAHNETAPAA